MKLLSSALLAAILTSSTNGQIYADFQTSEGLFTCELAYQEAPQTVANFIGLAEGSRAWIDPATGAVMNGEPFYDGITFHRVIEGFMNQAGSRNGLGTDGPGYTFRDETDNGLDHSQPYVLSMANSGPNTNGSQFFVTAGAANHLNGVHTVFGKVISGPEVVDAINQAPVDGKDKPLDPIVIDTVSIRREGAAAQEFDIHAQQLPVVSRPAGTLRVSAAGEVNFLSTLEPGERLAVHHSTDLASWSPHLTRYLSPDDAPAESHTLEAEAATQGFFNVSKVTSPGALGPGGLAGRHLVLPLTGGVLEFEISADGETGETTFSPDAGAALSSPLEVLDFLPDAYGFRAVFHSPNLMPSYFLVRVGLDDGSSDNATGRHSTDSQTNVGWESFARGPLTISESDD